MQKIFKNSAFLFLFFAFVNSVSAASPGDIIITEIKTGETGATNNEFVEIFNKTSQDMDLAGWSLKKKTQSGTESNLVSAAKFVGVIKANGFLLIAHPNYINIINADLAYSGSSYSIASDNTVILYDAEDAIIDKLGYGEAADFSGVAAPALETNQSLARKFIDGGFADTNNNSADFEILASPNPQNSSSLISGVAQIQNNPETAPAESVVPAASVADNSNSLSEDIGTPAENQSGHDYSNDIIVSEIFPNPYLGDAGEWIELYNKGENDVILTGWRIGDDSGQQYGIATGTIIKTKDFLVIYRKDSKIILDNDKDSVKLYRPSRITAAETIRYKTAPESQSYARDLSVSNRWLWTKEFTPGEENIVEPANSEPEAVLDFPSEAPVGQPVIFDGSDSFDDDGDTLVFKWNFGDGASSSLETAEHTFWKAGTYAASLSVSDGKAETKKEKKIKITGDKALGTASSLKAGQIKTASADKTAKTVAKAKSTKSASVKSKAVSLQIAGENLAVGSFKRLTGIVAVKPGVFGSQYFYMVGSPGIQVYNYKKDFPKLTVGDKIEAAGIISDNNGEARLKTKSRADIRIIENRGAPESVSLAVSEVNADAVNELVRIQGEVTDKKGQSVFIDDGSGEAEAYIKKGAGIAMAVFEEGKQIALTGLVVKYKDGYRLMPRSVDDIKTENKGEVLGVAITNDEWSLAERDKKKELIAYLAVIVGGAVLAGAGFLIKKKMAG